MPGKDPHSFLWPSSFPELDQIPREERQNLSYTLRCNKSTSCLSSETPGTSPLYIPLDPQLSLDTPVDSSLSSDFTDIRESVVLGLVRGLFGVLTYEKNFRLFVFVTHDTMIDNGFDIFRIDSFEFYVSFMDANGCCHFLLIDDKIQAPLPLKDSWDKMLKVRKYLQFSDIQFYYSRWVDLTKHFQECSEDTARAFFCNRHGLSFLSKQHHHQDVILKAVEGVIEVSELDLDTRDITHGLPLDVDVHIPVRFYMSSIKNINRAGTRFMSRGVDTNGEVANSFESRTSILYQEYFASFLQLRGSVPLFWYQYNILDAAKFPEKSLDDSVNCLKRHFEKLSQKFKKTCVINLLSNNPASGEVELSNRYLLNIRRLQQADPNFTGDLLQYYHYDFYQEYFDSPTMNDHDKNNIMGDVLDTLIENFGFYLARTSENGVEPLQDQIGGFRINCLDCLDRTNAIQRDIAIRYIPRMLAQIFSHAWNVSLSSILLSLISHLNSSRKYLRLIFELWKLNGHVISRNYCGTDSLQHSVNLGAYSNSGTDLSTCPPHAIPFIVRPKSSSSSTFSKIFHVMKRTYLASSRHVQAYWYDAEKHEGMLSFYGQNSLTSAQVPKSIYGHGILSYNSSPTLNTRISSSDAINSERGLMGRRRGSTGDIVTTTPAISSGDSQVNSFEIITKEDFPFPEDNYYSIFGVPFKWQ